MYSLIQVSLDADIPLQQAVKFACHLVHWGQAMPVYPLSETNVYINSPQANTKRYVHVFKCMYMYVVYVNVYSV